MTVLPGLPGRSSGGCLGDRVADLADGRLPAAEAETAFAHVAVCDRCRVALDTARAASAALAEPAPAPSEDFLARLLGIPAAEAAAARPFVPPVVVPAQAGTRPSGAAGVRPAATPSSSRPATRRRRVRVAVGSAAGAAALAVAAVVGGAPAALGGPQAPASQFAPVVDALADEHSASTQRMPFSGPLVITAAFDSGSGSSVRP